MATRAYNKLLHAIEAVVTSDDSVSYIHFGGFLPDMNSLTWGCLQAHLQTATLVVEAIETPVHLGCGSPHSAPPSTVCCAQHAVPTTASIP